MKMTQKAFRERCEPIAKFDENGSQAQAVHFGAMVVRPLHAPTGVSLGNMLVSVTVEDSLLCRGRFNQIVTHALHVLNNRLAYK